MRTLICILLGIGVATMRSQSLDWESLIDPESEEDRVDELLEFFEWRQANPLDINRARTGEWQEFPWIDAATARAIVAARTARGGFRQVSDLQALPALSREAYRRLLPFIVCAERQQKRTGVKLEGRHRWTCSRPRDSGSGKASYAGDDSRRYHKLRFVWQEHLSGSLVIEKDPGESSPADLFRGSTLWTMPWFSGRLCLGAFTLESGRGLLFPGRGLWGGGIDPVADYRPRDPSLRPSASTSENGGQEGVALALASRGTGVILFQSRSEWDARVEEGKIRSLQWSGLHRNPAESGMRDALAAASRGILVQHRFGPLRLSATWQGALYSHAIAADSGLENRHDFSGSRNWNSGVEAELLLHGVTGYVEWACSRGSGSALEAGVLLQIARMKGIAARRRYSPAYHRLLTTLADDPANEEGWYLALQTELPRRVRLAVSHDFSRNLAPAWRQPMPLIPRHASALQLTWQPLQNMSCFHRLRHKNWSLTGTVDDRFGNPAKEWQARTLWSFISQMEYQLDRLTWRTRLEYRRFRLSSSGALAAAPDSSGWMLYQQLGLALGRRTTLVARYLIFSTPCYETRFYLYENDLPGALAFSSLNGRGCRAFLLCNLGLSRSLLLSGKVSLEPGGAAPEEAGGQRRPAAGDLYTVAVQLDWRLPGR
jgi:hypothetical protein